MKIPEKPPKLDESREKYESARKGYSNDFVFDRFVNLIAEKANRDYFYWDKVKYMKVPEWVFSSGPMVFAYMPMEALKAMEDELEGVSPEALWHIVKLSRMNKKYVPLFTKDGNEFNYWVPDSAQEMLHYITQNMSGQIIIDEPGLSADKDRYIISSLMEEAITSSQIEGAVTTTPVAKDMIRTGRKPANHSEKMILNNYKTINKIKELVDRPLSPELLFELHLSMTTGTLEDPSMEGRFRNENEPIELHFNEQVVLFVPPPAVELESMIRRLCNFANEKDDTTGFMHPVVRGIILHFMLAYIHPFNDGNGRTARALFYWYMLKKKYWLFEFLSISKAIQKSRIQYYKAYLYTELDENDMTYFIVYHLKAIKDAIEELQTYIVKKQQESKEAVSMLSKYPALNHRQRAILIHAVQHPEAVYTVQTHKNLHGITHQTARTDLMGLVEKGLLLKFKQGRGFHFMPAKDLKKIQ